MRNYTVEISIDFDDGIVDSKCSCPRGLAACHHLCIYSHHNISVTDKACVWNKPNIQDEVDVITKIKDIFQPKRTNYTAVQTPANENELDLFKKELGDSNPTGFSWWLMSTPSEKILLIPSIEDIIFSEEYANTMKKEAFFIEKCGVTKAIVQSVHQLTIGQGNNENWLIASKHRITSSEFGVVLSACRRNKYPKSLFKSLLERYDLSGVQAIRWGRDNEKCGVDKF
ncbi:uncharacterized protein [Leptinotarsa decemlineata]|uniref:uncharacterized protein n=1 Tax=Leptinotarsa decemlineata TaxID=7539 RepID=UPI003D3090A8